MTIAEPKTRKWTRDEYHQMADIGFFDGQRVELIGGEIIDMAPQKGVHAVTIGLAREAVANIFTAGFWIREQLPLAIGPHSEPEPDVSIVIGKPRDSLGRGHPQTAVLVIEVSDTTLLYDRQTKASLYASAGIQGYWIINLVDRQIEVLRLPTADDAQPYNFRYANVDVRKSGESIATVAKPEQSIFVSDLLP